MGKKDRAADAHKVKEEKKKELLTKAANADPTLPMLGVTCVACVGLVIFSSIFFHSEVEGRAHFVSRFVCFGMLETALGSLFSVLLLAPARKLVVRMPGGAVSDRPLPWGPTEEEQISNDDTIVWPHTAPLAKLPADWLRAAKEKKRAFHLNHVRGTLRLKHALMRWGAALGSLANVAVLAVLIDKRPLSALGIVPGGTFAADLLLGLGVGATLIGLVTAAELRLGWVRVLGYKEVADPAESFSLNLAIDALFHVAVSINEELQLRGWLLLNLAEACAAHFSVSRATALLAGAGVESVAVAMMHLGSPGASAVSMLNLAVGGFAAAANVLLSGSLAFSLGWHWGWNFTMGNLLGRSTSGIPISATLVSVAPHPSKSHLHGGTFGPEGGVLAPAAYVLGVAMLYMIYGTERFGVVSEDFPALAAAK